MPTAILPQQSYAERTPRICEVPTAWADEIGLPLSSRVATLLSQPQTGAEPLTAEVAAVAFNVITAALKYEDPDALLDLHRSLFLLYEASLSHPLSCAAQHESRAWFQLVKSQLETEWYLHEYRAVADEMPADEVLRFPELLSDWFVRTANRQSTTTHALARYLEEKATVRDIRDFVRADGYLNYRFYDALSLAQQHFAESVKNEISHHMWDEAGQGATEASHTVLFGRTLDATNLEVDALREWTDWRPIAGFNLYFLLGRNRRHYFKSLGSLAMPELFDSDRDRSVVAALKRLGLDASQEFLYYAAHMSADAEHGPSWLENVVLRVVEIEPLAARDLAIGGLLRMRSMEQFNAYLASQFDLPTQMAA